MGISSVDNFIKQKKEAKKMFADRFSFSSKKPLLGVVLDKELSGKDSLRLMQILEGAANVNVQVAVLSDCELKNLKTSNTIILPYSRANRKHLMQAADMALGFKFSDVEEMLLNGTIPISPSRREVSDYDPNKESGNGFIYRKVDHWCMFAALVRALETFKFPYDWNNIVRSGLESVLI
ncbi:MAG: hypothetical protein O3B47_00430 [bacterium]|nr:hypothetical protein [bacterium]